MTHTRIRLLLAVFSLAVFAALIEAMRYLPDLRGVEGVGMTVLTGIYLLALLASFIAAIATSASYLVWRLAGRDKHEREIGQTRVIIALEIAGLLGFATALAMIVWR